MASKLAILIAVLGVLAFLLFEPIPKGYSSASSAKLRVLAGAVKAVKFVADTSEQLAPLSGVNIRRAACRVNAGAPHDESIRTHDTEFDGVHVRIYEPTARKDKKLPGIVYYHGGGFVICDVESFDGFVRELAKRTNTVIASVDYRLAPEHHYPAAHDDCLTATKYFIKHAKRFNVDPTRIAVAGDSAGGNLAASMALRLRDEKHSPPLKLQVLIFPTLQLIDLNLPSMVYNKIDPALKTYEVSYYYAIYLNVLDHRESFENGSHIPASVRQKLMSTYINVDKLPSQYTAHYHAKETKTTDQKLWNKIKSIILNPYFSPLLAPKLEGLPKAFIYTCENDILRDDGILYAERLREEGVAVEHLNDPLGFHNNIIFALGWPEFDTSLDHMAEYIVANL